MSVILEKQLLSHILYNPETIEKVTLNGEHFSDVIVRCIYTKLREKHNETDGYEFINKDVLPLIYENNKEIFNSKDITTFKEIPKYIFSDYDKESSFDWMFSENIIKEEFKRRKYVEVLEKTIEDLDDASIDSAMSNLDMNLRSLDKENPRDSQLILGNTFTDIYDERTKEIEELKHNDKPSYYAPFHPVLKKYIRMKRGMCWNIIGKTGEGKSLVSVQIMLEFAREYDERTLYITDENSAEVILSYFHAAYFQIKYKDIEDRIVNLTQHIKNLSPKDKAEYDRVFGLIEVIELPSIPLLEVRRILKNAENNDNPYTFIFADSMDEIGSDMNVDEVTRYDLNAKQIERIAKDHSVIFGVSNQLNTNLYTTSVEKIPSLCTHQSKTIGKKVFMALVIGDEYKNNDDGEVESLGQRIRILKSRSGGMNVIYPFERRFDYCSILPSDHEIGKDGCEVGF